MSSYGNSRSVIIVVASKHIAWLTSVQGNATVAVDFPTGSYTHVAARHPDNPVRPTVGLSIVPTQAEKLRIKLVLRDLSYPTLGASIGSG